MSILLFLRWFLQPILPKDEDTRRAIRLAKHEQHLRQMRERHHLEDIRRI